MVDKAEQTSVLADAFQENATGEQKIPTGKKLIDFVVNAPVEEVLDFFLEQVRKGPKEKNRIGQILTTHYHSPLVKEGFYYTVLDELFLDRARDIADHIYDSEDFDEDNYKAERFHKVIEILKALDEKKVSKCLCIMSFEEMLRLDIEATLDFMESLPQEVVVDSLYAYYQDTGLKEFYDIFYETGYLLVDEVHIARALTLIAKSIDHVAKSEKLLDLKNVASPTGPVV